MSIDISVAAKGLANVLNPGGTFGMDFARSGGSFVGSLTSVQVYLPSIPYQGATPLALISSLPLTTEVNFDGAGVNRVDGQLSLLYITKTPYEQNKTLRAADNAIVSDINAMLQAILSDRHLANSVVSVTEPIEIIRDPEGYFREFQGTLWSLIEIRIPFIGKPL